MSVYVIAQISITDPESYAKYQAAFMDVFAKYDGRLLAADPVPTLVEGDWDYEKLILMSFSDESAFKEWAFSAEYQAISKDRKAGSDGNVLLVKYQVSKNYEQRIAPNIRRTRSSIERLQRNFWEPFG